MKTIKFRVWDTQERVNQMIYLTPEFLKERQGNLQDFLYSDRFIPMQFTGLLDKQNKEIYEGDLMKSKYNFAWRKWWSDLVEKKELDKDWEKQKKKVESDVDKVEFRKGCFEWGYKNLRSFCVSGDVLQELFESDKGGGGEGESRWWDFEIIGNIYQNPKLLK